MAIDYNWSNSSTNDYYEELAQAFLDEQWDNTAAKAPENGGVIMEQAGIGESTYHEIEAWVKTSVGDVTTGLRDSYDFLRIFFRDIKHRVVRGLYYKFNNSYWIVNDYSSFNGIAQEVGLRRCNDSLKMNDPLNGTVFDVPCVVDYDMASPSAQVSRHVITPNNHAVVTVQGNADTFRLFKINTRFMLGGRPFKLFAYQNAMYQDMDDDRPTYIQLDLYLDELHNQDNAETGVADNGSTSFYDDSEVDKMLENMNKMKGGM